MKTRRFGSILLALALGGAAFTSPTVAADEETWSIRCVTLSGPDRVKQAEAYAAMLRKVKGLDARLITVIGDERESVLCYGRYQRKYDIRSGSESFKPDPVRDLNVLRELSIQSGDQPAWPFRFATLGPLPGGGDKRPEWEISAARGTWSLQVAVFYDEGEMTRRREAAVEYCGLLRQQGVEAYFHHGPVNSSVCVGAFPKEAIQTIQRKEPFTGRTQFKQKIVDEKLLELQRKFPHNLHNGRVFYDISQDASGAKQRTAHESFPVEIPRGGGQRPAGPDRRPAGEPRPPGGGVPR